MINCRINYLTDKYMIYWNAFSGHDLFNCTIAGYKWKVQESNSSSLFEADDSVDLQYMLESRRHRP